MEELPTAVLAPTTDLNRNHDAAIIFRHKLLFLNKRTQPLRAGLTRDSCFEAI